MSQTLGSQILGLFVNGDLKVDDRSCSRYNMSYAAGICLEGSVTTKILTQDSRCPVRDSKRKTSYFRSLKI